MRKSLLLVIVVMSFALIVVSCSSDKEKSGEPAPKETEEQQVAVPAIYRQTCLSCHGDQLQGRVGPNLQTIGSKRDAEQIEQIIRKGKGGMPSYEKTLKDDEIDTLVNWLMEQK